MSNRDKLEAEYIRSVTEEWDVPKEVAVAKVNAARSTPQKNKRLHAIHEAHMALTSKQAEIDEFDSNLVVMRDEVGMSKVESFIIYLICYMQYCMWI